MMRKYFAILMMACILIGGCGAQATTQATVETATTQATAETSTEQEHVEPEVHERQIYICVKRLSEYRASVAEVLEILIFREIFLIRSTRNKFLMHGL